MSDDFEMFWMVYLAGGSAPAHKHSTEASARAEALRLVQRNGGEATVLVSIAQCIKRDTFWLSPAITPENGAPF